MPARARRFVKHREIETKILVLAHISGLKRSVLLRGNPRLHDRTGRPPTNHRLHGNGIRHLPHEFRQGGVLVGRGRFRHDVQRGQESVLGLCPRAAQGRRHICQSDFHIVNLMHRRHRRDIVTDMNEVYVAAFQQRNHLTVKNRPLRQNDRHILFVNTSANNHSLLQLTY